MKRSNNPAKLYIVTLTLTLIVAACQPTPNTAVDPNNTQTQTPRPNGQATALIPATLGPTPTQFQPELTSQAVTQTAGQAPLGIKQLAGVLAIVPSHYEWSQQSGSTQSPDGIVQFSIQVALENTSTTDPVSFDPAQFSLLDSTGKSLPISLTATNTQAFTAQTLNPGDKVQGNLFYEVPESQQTETGWSVRLVFAAADGQSYSWSLAG